MPTLVPSAGCIRTVCECLRDGVDTAPAIIERTGYSKRSVWTTLQWLRANGYTEVDAEHARGRSYQHRLVKIPEPEVPISGPDAIALAQQSRWDARALFAALHMTRGQWSPCCSARVQA